MRNADNIFENYSYIEMSPMSLLAGSILAYISYPSLHLCLSTIGSIQMI
jgi:hypothetical protein